MVDDLCRDAVIAMICGRFENFVRGDLYFVGIDREDERFRAIVIGIQNASGKKDTVKIHPGRLICTALIAKAVALDRFQRFR